MDNRISKIENKYDRLDEKLQIKLEDQLVEEQVGSGDKIGSEG